MSKSNICLFSIAKQFSDDISKDLSEKMDVFYANFDEIAEFELMDMNRMEEVCGRDYLAKREFSIIKRICTYENTLINMNYSMLNDEKNLNIIKDNCLLIYLKLNKDRYKKEIQKDCLSAGATAMNIDIFEERDKLCEKYAEVVVDCMNLNYNEIIDIVIMEILKYFN